MKLSINKTPAARISEDMYGLFFEDINYGLDGGLHAEMLENRNFESVHVSGFAKNYKTNTDGKHAWNVYENNGDGSVLYIYTDKPLNEINPHYLSFQAATDGASFANKAYDGLYVKKGLKYYVSFYAKQIVGQSDVVISVKKYGQVLAQATVAIDGGAEWKQYKCELEVDQDAAQADFVVSLTKRSEMAFDQFSMMPSDAVEGVFRRDLAEKLKALKPSFLRFPGGCIVEGAELANRYCWKKTIGPKETRVFNWNLWAVHNPHGEEHPSCFYSNYGQTYGVGFFEYFLLCEYLGAKALPVLSVGLGCQFRSDELVPVDSPEMEEYIQDALDLVEFANGSVDTFWGAKRAEMGHPEPFGLEYIGVGNEQWETERCDFFRRATMFEERIHAKYPEMKIIGSAGPDVSSERYTMAWDYYREEVKKNPNCVHAVDEHYYVKPEWLYENVHFYDNYDRNIKVFAGEYACHITNYGKTEVDEVDARGNMNCPYANCHGAALAEASFLTGVERNADVVIMACYAPLFARLGYAQWSPDLIWFNGEKSYGTPSYYVQQMYSCNRGVATLVNDWNAEKETAENVYISTVVDADGSVIVKAVNVSDVEKELEFDVEDMAAFTASVTEIYGNKLDYNSIAEEKIHPQQYEAGSSVVLKPNSFAVIRLPAVK